jgi:hypothetical protein
MNSNVVAIVVALIGLVGAVSAAFIARPRSVPAPQRQPQSQPQATWRPASYGHERTASPGVNYVMPSVKISASLWWGIAGIFLWLLPILGYIVTLPGLFIAIRDLRSPGARRLATIGLLLCLLAFVLTITNSAIGAYQGAHGTGWWQNG